MRDPSVDDVLDALLRGSQDGVAVLDERARVVAANGAFGDLLGHDPHALPTAPLSQLERGAWQGLVGHIARALDVGHARFDTRHHRCDGRTFDLEVSLTRVDPAASAGEARVLCFLRDATERERAQLALHESLDMLQVLTHAQTRFIADGDPRDVFNELLEHVLRLTGSGYGFIGEVFRNDAGEPYLQTHAMTNIAWSAETRRLYEQSAMSGFTFKKLDTLYGHVLTTGRPIIANAPAEDPRRGGLPHGHPALNAFLGLPLERRGDLVGMLGVANRPGGYDDALVAKLQPFLATCAALIEAHRNEAQRKRAAEALGEARALLLTALDAGGVGTWTADLACERFACDASVAKLLRVAPEQVRDLPVAKLLSFVHADDVARVQLALEQARATGALEIELRVSPRPGDVTSLTVKGSVQQDGDRHTRRLVGACADVTRNRVLEEQLRQAQKMEAIGQLAGGVAHDFNNLLTIILGNTAVLEAARIDADAREATDQIVHAADRAAALTRQLLTFGRRQPMRLGPLDVNAVVRSASRMLDRVLGESIRLVATLAPQLPAVDADPAMLEQVILNLAVNARDAMPTGGELRLRTEVVDLPPSAVEAGGGRCVRLTVSDTGTGIAPEHLPRLFEPFFTTKEIGHGTGLGLATVYGIVKQHRGSIAVASEPGSGAAFTIDLPALRQRAPVVAEASEPAAPEGGTETILFVEDERSVRALVVSTLERQGYRVLAAASGPEALELWRMHRDRIALLVTDLVMPDGLSGDQLARLLLQDSPRLPVIYTSGYSAELLGPSAIGDRAGFLHKPFKPADLARLVRERLARAAPG